MYSKTCFFPLPFKPAVQPFFYLLKPARPFVRAHHCAVSASPLAQAKLIEPSVRLSVAYR